MVTISRGRTFGASRLILRYPEHLRTAVLEDLGAVRNNPYELRPVVLRSDGTVVGHCGLLEKEIDGAREIERVYVLAKAAWGRGYATELGAALRDEAFHRLSIPKLAAIIDPENLASAAVAGRLGFTYTRDLERLDPFGGHHQKRLYLCEPPRGATTPPWGPA